MREQLDRASQTPRPDEVANEVGRQQSLDDLHVIDSLPDERIDQVVRAARDLFGVSSAALRFLDRDRRWVKSALGTAITDSPRVGSLCDMAIAHTGVFVVEDIQPGDAVAAGGEDTAFYAGFPIESPRGRRVGVLCIMNSESRKFSTSESSLLRQLGLQVQQLVWDIP